MLERNIEDKTKNSEAKFLKVYSHLVAGHITFNEFFEKYYNKDFTYDRFIEEMKDSKDLKNLFAKKVLDYYAGIDPIFITQDQVDFVADKCIKLKFSNFNKESRGALVMPRDKEYLDISRSVYANLGLLQKDFERRGSYLAYVVDGQRKNVDDDVLDQALAYAKSKNIYRCNYTISKLAKEIVCGNIDYSEETQQEMAEMQKTVLEMVQESQVSETQQQN